MGGRGVQAVRIPWAPALRGAPLSSAPVRTLTPCGAVHDIIAHPWLPAGGRGAGGGGHGSWQRGGAQSRVGAARGGAAPRRGRRQWESVSAPAQLKLLFKAGAGKSTREMRRGRFWERPRIPLPVGAAAPGQLRSRPGGGCRGGGVGANARRPRCNASGQPANSSKVPAAAECVLLCERQGRAATASYGVGHDGRGAPTAASVGKGSAGRAEGLRPRAEDGAAVWGETEAEGPVPQLPASGGRHGEAPPTPPPPAQLRPRGWVAPGCRPAPELPSRCLQHCASAARRARLMPFGSGEAVCSHMDASKASSWVCVRRRKEGRGKPAVRAFLLMSLFYHVGVEILCKESNRAMFGPGL